MFAAAAIASTPSLSALVPVATQAVLMAFRTGLHVSKLAGQLSPPGKTSDSWTYIFPNQTEEKVAHVLSDFNTSNVSFAPVHHVLCGPDRLGNPCR